jgi:hypothetical protein
MRAAPIKNKKKPVYEKFIANLMKHGMPFTISFNEAFVEIKYADGIAQIACGSHIYREEKGFVEVYGG